LFYAAIVIDCQKLLLPNNTVTNSPNLLSDGLCVDDNVIERVYSFTLFGIIIQCSLKWTAHVHQTILAVVYNQSRTTNKSRYFILQFAVTVTKGVKQFSIWQIVFPTG